MKILILSNASWDTRNSVGNTLSNWFEGWEDTELSFIYSREVYPNRNCCTRYLSVSLINILKNIFQPWKIGNVFYKIDDIEHCNIISETFHINSINGFKRRFIKLLVDLLYSSNIWFNRKVRQFIHEADPDIVFMFSIPDSFRYNLLKYIKKNTNAKIVQYIADDIYGATFLSNSLLNRIQRRRYHKVINLADKLYGASVQMCERYQYLFGKSIVPLYKGCEVESPRTKVNTPLRIVYAGNLSYGRDSTLIALVNAISKINENEERIQLLIYSGAKVDDSLLKKIDVPGCSKFCGRLDYEQIKEQLHQADFVLHVESFDSNQIEIVKYSFSTKIIDCLQSGSCMLVVGPKGISSVEYPRSIEGTVVIDNIQDIYSKLLEVVSNPQRVVQQTKMINLYAQEYHSLTNVRKSLKEDFELLIDSNK